MGRPKKDKKPDPRINLAFYDDNLKFIQYASWKNRMSITAYMNRLIEKDKDNYARNEWALPQEKV